MKSTESHTINITAEELVARFEALKNNWDVFELDFDWAAPMPQQAVADMLSRLRKKKTIIVTAGPTNERIDAVMQITNMSTGALGARIVEAMLGTRRAHSVHSCDIRKIYYIRSKLTCRPDVHSTQTGKIQEIVVNNTENLLTTLRILLTNQKEHIDAVVHSAAVGDYKGRYTARAEDIAMEIANAVASNPNTGYQEILSILAHPECIQNSATKISSYEPNLFTMMDLTPKVIGEIKKLSPETMLIGFKLLEGVTRQELFDAASRLRQKNQADYIVANNLACIGHGLHWAMIIGHDDIHNRDAVIKECETKADIAKTIASLILPESDT